MKFQIIVLALLFVGGTADVVSTEKTNIKAQTSNVVTTTATSQSTIAPTSQVTKSNPSTPSASTTIKPTNPVEPNKKDISLRGCKVIDKKKRFCRKCSRGWAHINGRCFLRQFDCAVYKAH